MISALRLVSLVSSRAYLGDSGNQGTVLYRMIMKTSWNANGNLQDIGPDKNENPYVIQFDKEKPAMLQINSMTTSFPRHLICDVSVCQTGAVEVFKPLPIPAMIRPVII